MDKYKFCVSIPVHEKPDVVIDQIENIQYFYDNEAAIILHVSPDFKFDDVAVDSNYFLRDGVYVNSESLPVVWGTLMHVHNSNFKYACNKIDFQYFIIHSSNDMYVRKGVGEYIEKTKNGIHQAFRKNEVQYLSDHITRDWSVETYLDPEFIGLMKYLDITQAVGSQCEGTFYEKEVFAEMLKVIDKFYIYGREKIYPREEYWYSTIIQKFTKVEDLGKPFVLSEIWRADGIVINQEMILRLHNKELVDDVVKLKYPYDYNNLYAVKRITRDYNHPDRILLRELIEKEKDEKLKETL